MILIAILATYSALYTVMRNRNAAYPWAALIMTLAFSLSAALPALWIGAFRRIPPDALLVRFAIGNGFIPVMIGLMVSLSPGGFLIAIVAVAAIIPSIGWYRISQMANGEARERMRHFLLEFLSYVLQLSLTIGLCIVMSAILR